MLASVTIPPLSIFAAVVQVPVPCNECNLVSKQKFRTLMIPLLIKFIEINLNSVPVIVPLFVKLFYVSSLYPNPDDNAAPIFTVTVPYNLPV